MSEREAEHQGEPEPDKRRGQDEAGTADEPARPKRTPEELDRDMRIALAGLTGIGDIASQAVQAAGVPDLFRGLDASVFGPNIVGDGLEWLKFDANDAPLPAARIPAVASVNLDDFEMPPPPANAEQLERLHDATERQGAYLGQIVTIMAESVALSREATEAAKATAAQASESQRTARQSVRVAKVSVWLVVVFGLVQVVASLVPLFVG